MLGDTRSSNFFRHGDTGKREVRKRTVALPVMIHFGEIKDRISF
jgi:hypothetical protein